LRGTLRLTEERVEDWAWVAQLLERCEAHEIVARELDLATGVVSLSGASKSDVVTFDGERLRAIYGPRWRLLLIGAGQLSRYVAQMARLLDFEVLICDPREEFVYGWEEQHGRFVPGMPDEAVLNIQTDERTAVVCLTHDPRLDDMALLTALNSNAFYIGALGSRVNSQKRRENLAALGLSADAIARLHGPIGLHIGSHTPSEIALSLLAEIVAIKNGVAPMQKKPLRWQRSEYHGDCAGGWAGQSLQGRDGGGSGQVAGRCVGRDGVTRPVIEQVLLNLPAIVKRCW
jgi:xanthine dehydrogenase accessory factor